jgi:hypothetical protein
MMKEPPDKKIDKGPTHKAIKTSLKSIAKNDVVIEKLNEVVIMTNKIVIHTLQFMKLYFIDCYDTNKDIPYINRALVKCFMKVLCKAPTQGRKPKDETIKCKEELEIFYKKHYSYLKTEELHYTHMNTILDYVADSITTIYENNIEQRFVMYVERFVNVVWKKKELITIIRNSKKSYEQKNLLINNLCSELRKIKNDILHPSADKTSKNYYHKWINELKILPNREYQKNNVFYDLVCSPQDYLLGMIFMMKQVEKADVFMCGVFPLRREILPKYIPIDTTTLVHILMNKDIGKKDEYLTKGNLVANQNKLWNFFFKTDKQLFHLDNKFDYQFANMIETDGVGCSILLVRKDLKGKRKNIQKKFNSTEKYIDELTDYKKLQDKNIVAIDPNKSDLIFCVDSNSKSFRYTQDQRRKETKQKKYRNILQEYKLEKIENKTITEWETELSFHNSKTLNFDMFKLYIQKKNELNLKIGSFYERKLFRKLKLGSFMMRQKTEAKMLRNFEKKFGAPDKVVIGFGDYSKNTIHMKYKEPVKGKGFRTLLRKKGYEVYLVNEFRTSCRCSHCEGECKTFRKCTNPRPWKSNIITRHGLLECKTCNRLWNRDMNASLNILEICKEAIAGNERPVYLKRSVRPLSDTASVLTPTI